MLSLRSRGGDHGRRRRCHVVLCLIGWVFPIRARVLPSSSSRSMNELDRLFDDHINYDTSTLRRSMYRSEQRRAAIQDMRDGHRVATWKTGSLDRLRVDPPAYVRPSRSDFASPLSGAVNPRHEHDRVHVALALGSVVAGFLGALTGLGGGVVICRSSCSRLASTSTTPLARPSCP